MGVTAVLGLIIYRQKALTETEVMPLALIASLLTTPYAWVYEHLMLLAPCLLLYLCIKQRGVAAAVWLLTVFVLPWGTFWLAQNRGSDTFTAFVPLIIAPLFTYFLIAKSPFQKAHDTIE